MLVLSLITNWSASTIIRHEEEILGMELNYKIDVPCVVQWSLLWFSAPARLIKVLGHDLKIKKYHEVANSAIIRRYCTTIWRGAHTEVLHSTHRKREVNKEMEGWMIRGSLAPSPSDGDDDELECSDDDC